MKLKLLPDRYDGIPTLPHLQESNVLFEGGMACIRAPLGDDEEFTVYFEGDSADVAGSIDSAKSLLRAIGQLDNKVQEACAGECEKSGLHPRNFEGELTYITISGESALLHYFGSSVNTEWDELVKLMDGNWTYEGQARA